MAIGGNVAACRAAAGMTQAALAAGMKSTRQAVCRLEAGKQFPSLATLLRAAESLGVDPCRLLEAPKKGKGKK